MSDKPSIDARLARLAARDEMIGGARVIARAEEGRGAILRAIATAIDEAVLPATLSLASGGQGRVTLMAAGRRLRSVAAAEGGLEAGPLLDASLDAEETETVDALMALLVAFAETAQGPVTIEEGRGTESGGRGLSTRRILELIPESDDTGASSAATVFETQADRFRDLLGDDLIACLVFDASGDGDLTGDESLIDTLEGFAEIAPTQEAPALSLWARQTGRPDGRAFARATWSDGTIAALAFPARAVGRVVAAFRGSCAD
jgi:hypothetical protein